MVVASLPEATKLILPWLAYDMVLYYPAYRTKIRVQNDTQACRAKELMCCGCHRASQYPMPFLWGGPRTRRQIWHIESSQDQQLAQAQDHVLGLDTPHELPMNQVVPPLSTIPINMSSNVSQASKDLSTIVTPAIARATLIRLARGYQAEEQAAAVAPATSNDKVCWLTSLRQNKDEGHCVVRPLFPRKGTRLPNGTTREKRRQSQFVHRLAVVAWKPWTEVKKMLETRMEVSHRCSIAQCFNPGHLHVESHGDNEKRKHLDGKP